MRGGKRGQAQASLSLGWHDSPGLLERGVAVRVHTEFKYKNPRAATNALD